MTEARARDVVFRMNGSLSDMQDIGCPGEWIADMELGIEEIYRLRSALRNIRDMGPMTVDDQRWRVAKDALGASEVTCNPP